MGTAHDGFEALTKARQLKPELILMDIHMPNCDGVSATRLIKDEMPEIKIVMLTVSEDEEDLFEAVRSGASGYLLKSLDANQFLDTPEDLQKGFAPFSPGLAEKILKEFSLQSGKESYLKNPEMLGEDLEQSLTDCGLNSRQIQVLILVAQGKPYREVASTLNIAERTVKYHMSEILHCLHLHNRAEVIAFAVKSGLTRP